MGKIKSKAELYNENIIGVKIKKTKNIHNKRVCNNENVTKFLNQTMYLKICWHCGDVYESKKINSIACSNRCSQSLNRRFNIGLNPILNMKELTKPANVKDYKRMKSYN